MPQPTVGERIARARQSWNRSQRDLEIETGISQATLSRIESGQRPVKLNEVLSLSWALGYTVAELTGLSPVRDRMECAARADAGASMAAMQEELTHFLELDAFLDEHGVPQTA
ncbi:helix-turn-helix domain-containing protein [Georgenia yuyongxinii]